MAGTTRNRTATVPTAQYDAGEGWETGQNAPSDKYVEVDPQGNVIGKATDKPKPGAYQRQLVAKGDTVTVDMRRALGLEDAAADDTDPGSVTTS